MESGPEELYFSSLRQGRFTIQKCRGCGTTIFYPRTHCTQCGSSSLEWITPTGQGTVFSTTTVRRKMDRGGDYNVSLIELDEGVRLMSRVDGVPPSNVQIGMRVEARILHHADQSLLVFTLVQESAL